MRLKRVVQVKISHKYNKKGKMSLSHLPFDHLCPDGVLRVARDYRLINRPTKIRMQAPMKPVIR
ncbi:hypothetical protein GGE67_005123 [Rhizobium leucaenae]|nr:hypothetical protein [Rhizobium leucaenae]